MSAQAGLDSVAMKILAFVTAVFLPPTFIAVSWSHSLTFIPSSDGLMLYLHQLTSFQTLFSMSMFDWQASSNNGDGGGADSSVTLSSNFWIFWAVSIPLTFIVLGSWYIWWQMESSVYETKYRDAEGARVTSGMAVKSLINRMKPDRPRHGGQTGYTGDVENGGPGEHCPQ